MWRISWFHGNLFYIFFKIGKLASRVLGAILAVPIPSNHPEFDKFIETDRTPQEKMARLAVLLSLQSPPTRQSLIKDAER